MTPLTDLQIEAHRLASHTLRGINCYFCGNKIDGWCSRVKTLTFSEDGLTVEFHPRRLA